MNAVERFRATVTLALCGVALATVMGVLAALLH